MKADFGRKIEGLMKSTTYVSEMAFRTNRKPVVGERSGRKTTSFRPTFRPSDYPLGSDGISDGSKQSKFFDLKPRGTERQPARKVKVWIRKGSTDEERRRTPTILRRQLEATIACFGPYLSQRNERTKDDERT